MDKILSNKSLVLALVVILLLVGYVFGRAAGKVSEKKNQTQFLKELMAGLPQIGNLSGKLLAMASDKKSLTVEVTNIQGLMTLPKNYQKKQVILNDQTRIIHRENKEAAAFNKEMEEAQKKAAATVGAPLSPPMPFVEKEIKVDDLKINDIISFNFELQANASPLDNSFTATLIVK